MLHTILNITDSVASKTDEKRLKEIHDQVAHVLSIQISTGQLDNTKEATLFVCTKYGCCTVTLIPISKFN